MTEYTPATDDIRYAYCYWMNGDCYTEDYVPSFDRWFAPYAEALDTVQRMKALTDAMIYWALEGESND